MTRFLIRLVALPYPVMIIVGTIERECAPPKLVS